MNIHWINLWKYWKQGYAHDIDIIDIELYNTMWGGTRIVLLNFGVVIAWNRKK